VFQEPLVVHGSGGIILVRNVGFASTCSQTLTPFHGDCHIAYVPSQPLVLGLSKLARLVNLHSKRLCSQQELTDAISAAIAAHMPCAGVFVCTRARHLVRAAEPNHMVCQCASGCFAAADSSHSQVRSCIAWSV
jgi:GTP cyclohydrolase I